MGRPRKNPPHLDRIAESGQHRVFERKAASLEVVLEDEQGLPLLLLDADNLSVGGVHLCGDVPMRVGAHLLLRFQLPTAELPVRLVGEVVRVSQAGNSGLGIRFLEVMPEFRAAIESWVAQTDT